MKEWKCASNLNLPKGEIIAHYMRDEFFKLIEVICEAVHKSRIRVGEGRYEYWR